MLSKLKKAVFAISSVVVVLVSCKKNDADNRNVEIPAFNFTQTSSFESNLSSYNIFKGTSSKLIPSDGFELLELSSALFTDYAYKQRLIKIPDGVKLRNIDGSKVDFPNGTILTKTFFYYNDDRDTALGKHIVETRLLIKESDKWNVATYLWNEAQTDATLKLDGVDTPVSWTNAQGNNKSTLYHVPTQNECMTCHQSNATMSPLGPTLVNLNRTVNRDGSDVNQLNYLQSKGLLEEFGTDQIAKMVDYKDKNAALSERGRAYLAMNCAHCHNPDAWDTPAQRDFDFRHHVPFSNTGISNGKDKILRNVINQEMPFIGTTMMDEEGVVLLIDYINSL